MSVRKNLCEMDWHSDLKTLDQHFGSISKIQPLHRQELLDLNESWFDEHSLSFSAGDLNRLLDQLAGEGFSSRYSGHQFGHYNPSLGDGRACILGNIDTPKQRLEIQLKGSGPTPYSRQGDGKAVLRSTIREYLGCIAMRGLGIRTTDALACYTSSEKVQRETIESAALLIRSSEALLRFGHIEYYYYNQQHQAVSKLLDYAISFYPNVKEQDYNQLFSAITERTAMMIAQWQLVGFFHGVMNTDNFSLLGDTMDYGPFAFMDHYDPAFNVNHSDVQHRYSYHKQPAVAQWNLAALAQAMSAHADDEHLRATVKGFNAIYQRYYNDGLCRKLGLKTTEHSLRLAQRLLELLYSEQVDFTLAFRRLGCDDLTEFEQLFSPAIKPWLNGYRDHLKQYGLADHRQLMNKTNPKYTLRTYLAQNAILKAEQGDFTALKKLRKLLAAPFDEWPDDHNYSLEPPGWATSICLSCSS